MTTLWTSGFTACTVLLLSGCAIMPTGPSMMALPGTGKNFEQFRADDTMCRDFALQQIGGAPPHQAATGSGVLSAAVGTAVGAAAGAAMGGRQGAGVGAGAGLLAGGLLGTEAARSSGYDAQKRYDYSYVQCMYAQGHLVPVSGNVRMEQRQSWTPYSGAIPPPPPGYPERYLPGAESAPGNTIPPPPPGPPPAPPPDVLPR